MATNFKYILVVILLFQSIFLYSQSFDRLKARTIRTQFSEPVIAGVPCVVAFTLFDNEQKSDWSGAVPATLNGEPIVLQFDQGVARRNIVFKNNESLLIDAAGFSIDAPDSRAIPLWMSVIPPLLAIMFALLFKEVFSALFIGLFSGTLIIYLYKGVGVFAAIFSGLFAIVDEYILKALFDVSHLSIIVFSMLIGAMVSVITKNGGMQGVINRLAKYANSPVSGQFITWLMGVMIFFDDYANTLVVGNTMRPVTDKLNISREKLAYIVDSTAAPIAAVAFITTWIGAELSYIQDGINTLGLELNPYQIFFNSLAYSFYPFLTLIFILMIIYQRCDFGPMLRFERDARAGNYNMDVHPETDTEEFETFELSRQQRPRARNAIIPVFTVVAGTIAGLIYTGYNAEIWADSGLSFVQKMSVTIGAADSYKALLWSSLGGLLVALLLSIVQRILTLHSAAKSMLKGFKTMLTAILILTLAWSLAAITVDMHTAGFISNIMLSASLSPAYIPAITFVFSAIVAFSTGTSWGTMAIMYPLILPATWIVCQQSGLSHDETLRIFYMVVSVVIAGAVLGDHCSPISDTTILSSLASSCDHIRHVNTQMPYALTVGIVSLIVCIIPAGYGVPVWLLYPVAIGLLYLFIRKFGKRV